MTIKPAQEVEAAKKRQQIRMRRLRQNVENLQRKVKRLKTELLIYETNYETLEKEKEELKEKVVLLSGQKEELRVLLENWEDFFEGTLWTPQERHVFSTIKKQVELRMGWAGRREEPKGEPTNDA